MIRLVDDLDGSALAIAVLGEWTDPLRIVGSAHDDFLRLEFDPVAIGNRLPGGILFEGGPGSDTLRGPETWNTWNLTDDNAGNLGGVSVFAFTGLENLFGSGQQDVFTLAEGASLAGLLDGGAGRDTLDYSAFSATVTVNLATGTATGVTGLGNIEELRGGLAEDTLHGPANDSRWMIDGVNAGTVASVSFSGFENLQGAADNEDAFDFYAAGRISGVADGGEGGNDSLTLVDGVFENVTFTSISREVGTIARDADLITFRGLEPTTDMTPGNKTVTDAAGASNILVSAVDVAIGQGPTTVSADTFPESFVFTDADKITINAGVGDDKITIRGKVSDLPFIDVYGGTGNDVLDGDTLSFDFSGDDGQDTLVYSTTAEMTLTDVKLSQNSVGLSSGLALVSVEARGDQGEIGGDQ